jgi:PAS domain S-box-containing protein
MSHVPAALAAKIIDHLRGYAIIGLTAEGIVTHWLADSAAITGYSRDEAVGMHINAIFTASDRAAGAVDQEIAQTLSDGCYVNCRWHLHKNGSRFWGNGLTLPMAEGEAVVIKVFRDETTLKLADDRRLLLLNELNHRVKNTLATVQSVAEQTLRAAGVDATVREDLSARLIALSRAHNVLVDQNWAGADLDVNVRDVVGPYDHQPSPFDIEGPLVRLHPSQAVTLSLVLHELATNAVKHGALRVSGGRVRINWNIAFQADGGRHMTLLWCESQGPAVTPPTRAGFGSRLISSAFSRQQGEARVKFEPGGLECALTLNLLDEEAPSDIA